MADYTINDGTANVNYDVIMQQSPQKNQFEMIAREITRGLSTPMTLRVSHTESNSVKGTDRHLVQFGITEKDSDGLLHTGTVHVVLAAPRDAVSEAELLAEWTKLKNFVDANFASLYRGSMP